MFFYTLKRNFKASNQLTLREAFKTPMNSAKQYRKLIVDAWIAAGFSFRSIEHDEVKTMLQYGFSNKPFKVPTRYDLATAISQRYEIQFNKLKNLLRNSAGRISITTDGWTDARSRAWWAVTGHFFDNALKIRSVLLGLEQMNLPPDDNGVIASAERVADLVRGVLAQVLEY